MHVMPCARKTALHATRSVIIGVSIVYAQIAVANHASLVRSHVPGNVATTSVARNAARFVTGYHATFLVIRGSSAVTLVLVFVGSHVQRNVVNVTEKR